MNTINLSKILSQHKKGWLAISPKTNKLIAKGKTLKEVLKKSNRKGIKNPTVFKSAPLDNLLAG